MRKAVLTSRITPDTTLEVSADGPGYNLELRISCYLKELTINIPTKDLVLAIKQIEEERDATEGLTTRPDRPKTGAGDDEGFIKRALQRALSELGEMLRDHRSECILREEIATTLWALGKADSVYEIQYNLGRFKEAYTRAVGDKTRGKPVHRVEAETGLDFGRKIIWPKP